MAELAASSRYELPGLLMLIVGTDPYPEGLWVSLHLAGGGRLLGASGRAGERAASMEDESFLSSFLVKD
jgi:hypothetical protein